MNMTPNQTPGVRFIAGFPVSIPNSTYPGDGFYNSHNDRDARNYGSVTTALVVEGAMTAFYILNGDHREGYARLIAQGLDACLDYFRQHIGQINKYSETPPGVAQVEGGPAKANTGVR